MAGNIHLCIQLNKNKVILYLPFIHCRMDWACLNSSMCIWLGIYWIRSRKSLAYRSKQEPEIWVTRGWSVSNYRWRSIWKVWQV